MIIISMILFGLAAVCNAVMDKLQFHFHKSVFRRKNPEFWNPEISWRTAKMIPGTKYKVDAWHLFKSAMIVCLAGSAVFATGTKGPALLWWQMFVVIGCYGVIWNMVFNIFFNRVLSK